THRSARIASGKSKPSRMRASRLTLAILAVAFLGFIGGLVMWNRDRAAARASVRSVAVMPFRDLSSTTEGRMLADGISEMLAARLGGVRDMHIAPPFDGAAVEESDDVATIAKRKNVHAVLRGSVQRSGADVRVTYSLVTADGATLASGSATRALTDLFALEDAVAEELIARLGREAPLKARAATPQLGPADQQKFVEAIGLLHGVKDEQAVDRAIVTLEGLLRNARESGAVNGQLARALLFKAKLARRPALIEQATVYATRGVALDANDADSQSTLGMLQNESGRHDDAARSFERALAMRPDKTEALVGLGDAFGGLGRAADAEAMYRKAVALRPDVTGAATKFGMFLYAQGRHKEAADQFRRVTELAPGFSHGWANLGGTLQALGRFDEAKAALRKSIEIQPTAAGWSNLGTVQFLSGDFDAARASYEHATQLAPGDPVMWVNLADAHRAAKSVDAKAAYERAIAASRDALTVNPNDARARARIALCLAKSDRGAEAQEEIRRALELDPTNAQILYNAAVIAALRGNSDSAVSWLERAIGAGYPAAEAAHDPELAPLRALPSFVNAVKSRA
ncbi:MAG TPA: tetratricopeptide repeat protein, partial [Thermoanaerobaculia bacterium]|nr:tetratricopeptide repeat protein [Thermoanaerobaculia bacterium]